MQTDGNFVLYTKRGRPIWATNTHNHPGAYFVVQDDGNLVIYSPEKKPLWASNTYGKKPCP
jgi:hypothetical protein